MTKNYWQKTRIVSNCSYVNGVDFVRSDRVLVNDFENLPRDWEHSKWDGLEGIKFFRDKVEFFHLSLSEETWKVVNQKDSFRFEPAHVEVYDEAYFAGFVMGILKKINQ